MTHLGLGFNSMITNNLTLKAFIQLAKDASRSAILDSKYNHSFLWYLEGELKGYKNVQLNDYKEYIIRFRNGVYVSYLDLLARPEIKLELSTYRKRIYQIRDKK